MATVKTVEYQYDREGRVIKETTTERTGVITGQPHITVNVSGDRGVSRDTATAIREALEKAMMPPPPNPYSRG